MSLRCEICGEFYDPPHNCRPTYKCLTCHQKFRVFDNFHRHREQCSEPIIAGLEDHDNFKLSKSGFNQFLVIYTLSNLDYKDTTALFVNEKASFTDLSNYVLSKLETIKFQCCCFIHFVKPLPDGEERTISYMCSSMKTLCPSEELEALLEECRGEIEARIDQFTQRGSGWILNKISDLEVRIAKYIPHSGGCYSHSLPKSIQAKHATLNIRCRKDCFMYSVLAALHPSPENAHIPSHYSAFIDTYDFNDVRGLVKLTDINRFERKNQISINVYTLGLDGKRIIPLRITKSQRPQHVNLFLHDDHYYWIKNFDRLLNSKNSHSEYHCCRCLQGFNTQKNLHLHSEYCNDHAPQRVQLPSPNEKLAFKEYEKMQKQPFIIYVDFETLATKVYDDRNRATFEYQHHVPCSYGMIAVDWQGKIVLHDFYRGADAGGRLIQTLIAARLFLEDIYEASQKPLNISIEEEALVFLAENCYICKKLFNDHPEKVRDHDHLTGQFRGSAHSSCNLQLKWNHQIPVVFHNLKNFDGHLIIQAIEKDYLQDIWVIPQTIEKYIGFKMDNFLFIDSYAFLSSSLDTLAANLPDQEKLHFLSQMFPHGNFQLLLKKGALPYEFMDSWEKFDLTSLPSPQDFYSTLTNTTIDMEVYERLQLIWDEFSCVNLGDFHDIYLKVDVLLLAAIFESFRSMSLEEFQLDPAHFFSTPGLSWAAALKQTRIELDYLTDIDMILMIEAGIRDGISPAMKRHCIANNPGCSNYDPTEPNTYIAYLDVNNLYGYALKQKLPYRNFRWVNENDYQAVLNEITSENTEKGYFLEVDLQYPKELHDFHNDYPLAPEKLEIETHELSPYQHQLLEHLTRKRTKTNKLIPNLRDKHHYVIHHQTLKYYLSKGLHLKKIHKILRFEEKAWLEPYILHCTSKRQQAKNSFEKDFWKLMVNSLYGKSIEDKRKHCQVEIALQKKIVEKYIKKPLFDQFFILDEDKAILKLRKSSVLLDKPIYLGFSVLELSKLHMYRLHYDTFKAFYGNNIHLLYTDTDSLCMKFKHPTSMKT